MEGTVTLSGNDVQFAAAVPPLDPAQGRDHRERARAFPWRGGRRVCSAATFVLTVACARNHVRPAASETETVATFKGQGTVTAEGLRQAKELGPLSRMAQGASGSAAYTATLGFRRGQPEVAISSTLQGMALSLPAPLSKNR